MDVLQGLEGLSDPYLSQKIHKTLALIKRTCALYPLDKIAFSFNGGKDSTVLLHLLRAALSQLGIAHQDANGDTHGLGGIRSFYFVKKDDFLEIKEFVQAMDKQYELRVDYLDEADFKRGLVAYLERTGVMAIILGTRRGDPNADDQELFCPSSDDWPPFMRVNPILSWAYPDVWAFLRRCSLPYCHLYDEGYTSLGSIANTLPNSALKRTDGTFCPAYLLADGRLERAGRVKPASSQAYMRKTSSSLTRSAALLVVGDELLAGKVEDSNTAFLCRELRGLGWQVVRMVMLPDDKDAIAAAVQSLAAAAEVVITTGGVGPTLDDVTMAAVARGLGQTLVSNPEMVRRLHDYFGPDLTPAHLKMAETPPDAELIDYTLDNGDVCKFPLVKCRNIFVLPGVPHLLRQKWVALKGVLQQQSGPLAPFRNCAIRLSFSDETRVAAALEEVEAAHGGEVQLGSYPVSNQADGTGLVITLDSKAPEALAAAHEHLQNLLPKGSVVVTERDVSQL